MSNIRRVIDTFNLHRGVKINFVYGKNILKMNRLINNKIYSKVHSSPIIYMQIHVRMTSSNFNTVD